MKAELLQIGWGIPYPYTGHFRQVLPGNPRIPRSPVFKPKQVIHWETTANCVQAGMENK